MKALHFIALIKNAFISFILGLLYVCVCIIFFNDIAYVDGYIELMIGIVLVFVSCGVINVIVLPVITLIDRRTMENQSFKELMLRYLPIFAAPFMIIFGVFVLAEVAEPEITMYVFLVMLVAYTNLYVYISLVKANLENEKLIIKQSIS